MFHKIHPYLTLFLLGITLILVSERFLRAEEAPVEVKITEVSRSESPLIDPVMLESVGERFLFRSVAESVIPSVVFIEATVEIDPRYLRERRRRPTTPESMPNREEEGSQQEEWSGPRQNGDTESQDEPSDPGEQGGVREGQLGGAKGDADSDAESGVDSGAQEGSRGGADYGEQQGRVQDQGPQDSNEPSDPDPFEGRSRFWDFFIHPRVSTMGSGVVISRDGYILTNHHVINGVDPDDIEVSLNDKRLYKARLVGSDPSTDIAVLKIEATDLQPVIIGNSDHVQVGDWVLAVGNPFRLRSTVTAGIVSATSRQVEIISDALRIESFIQTDAAINRGNSGGALVNTSGELIGINTAIATQDGQNQGYGFAVPSNLSLKIARDLIEYGEPRRGILGVSIQSITQTTAKNLGLNEITGVRIIGLADQGAARQQGLKLNDVILNVNGFKVSEANQLQERIALHRPGESVLLTVWRDGKTFEAEVPLRSPESLIGLTPEDPDLVRQPEATDEDSL